MTRTIFSGLLLALAYCGTAIAATAIDGTCAVNKVTAGTSLTLTQTTTSSPDVIVVGTHNERTTAQGSFATVSSISSTNLPSGSWHLRKRNQFQSTTGSPTGYNDAEEWWAIASGALTNEVITVTYSTTIDDATAGSCGISGADTINPYDNNVSLPAVGTGQTLADPTVTGMTTSNSSDMLLGFVFNSTGATQGSVGQFGSTNATAIIFSENNTGGTNQSYSSLQYLNVAATQSSITFSAASSAAVWQAIGDAICASGGTNCTGGSIVTLVPQRMLTGAGQ